MSAAWSMESRQIYLSLSLGSNSGDPSLPLSLAKSEKWTAMSVDKIMTIIFSLNFLYSSLEKFSKILNFSSFRTKNAAEIWWFSKGDLSL